MCFITIKKHVSEQLLIRALMRQQDFDSTDSLYFAKQTQEKAAGATEANYYWTIFPKDFGVVNIQLDVYNIILYICIILAV